MLQEYYCQLPHSQRLTQETMNNCWNAATTYVFVWLSSSLSIIMHYTTELERFPFTLKSGDVRNVKIFINEKTHNSYE